MATTRRTFLKTTTLLTAAVPLVSWSAMGALFDPTSGQPAAKSRGLLFDKADLPRIRANLQNPLFASLWQEMSTMDQSSGVDLAADTRFLEKEMRVTNHAVHMVRVRAVLERSSFNYAINGGADQLALARLALRRICDYPKWDYFLEGGRQVIGLQRAPEASIAVACALDWLGDALDADEIALAEKCLAERGAAACYTTLYGMKYPDRVQGWTIDPEDEFAYKFDLGRWPLILNSTNLKTVPIAGLGIAACWLRGRHPQAESWLALARSSARAFTDMFHPDGSYDEGPGYWGYTASHLAFFAEVLHRTHGIDDRSLLNYKGTMRYALAMSMPTLGAPVVPDESQRRDSLPYAVLKPAQDIINFGDSGINLDTSLGAWVAGVHADPLSQYMAKNVGALKSHWAAIWYDPARAEEPPGPALLDTRLDNDWVVSRTGWAPTDGVVALRSGGPANHEHADRNSVIFKAHGERLFHDPFRAGYTPKLERWKLRFTSAHTAVLVGGEGHQYHDGREGTNASWSWARVQRYATGPGWMCVTSDATEAYALVNTNIAKVERTVVFLKPDILLLLDRVKLKSKPEAVQVRYQVFNDDLLGQTEVASGGFTISRPFATLKGSASGLSALTTRSGTLDLPEQDGVFPFIEVESPAALEHEIFTISTAQKAGGAHGTVTARREGAGWRLSGEHGGQKISATLAPGPDGFPVLNA